MMNAKFVLLDRSRAALILETCSLYMLLACSSAVPLPPHCHVATIAHWVSDCTYLWSLQDNTEFMLSVSHQSGSIQKQGCKSDWYAVRRVVKACTQLSTTKLYEISRFIIQHTVYRTLHLFRPFRMMMPGFRHGTASRTRNSDIDALLPW